MVNSFLSSQDMLERIANNKGVEHRWLSGTNWRHMLVMYNAEYSS